MRSAPWAIRSRIGGSRGPSSPCRPARCAGTCPAGVRTGPFASIYSTVLPDLASRRRAAQVATAHTTAQAVTDAAHAFTSRSSSCTAVLPGLRRQGGLAGRTHGQDAVPAFGLRALRGAQAAGVLGDAVRVVDRVPVPEDRPDVAVAPRVGLRERGLPRLDPVRLGEQVVLQLLVEALDLVRRGEEDDLPGALRGQVEGLPEDPDLRADPPDREALGREPLDPARRTDGVYTRSTALGDLRLHGHHRFRVLPVDLPDEYNVSLLSPALADANRSERALGGGAPGRDHRGRHAVDEVELAQVRADRRHADLRGPALRPQIGRVLRSCQLLGGLQLVHSSPVEGHKALRRGSLRGAVYRVRPERHLRAAQVARHGALRHLHGLRDAREILARETARQGLPLPGVQRMLPLPLGLPGDTGHRGCSFVNSYRGRSLIQRGISSFTRLTRRYRVRRPS